MGASSFDGIRQTPALFRLDNKTVHHQIDIVLLILLTRDGFIQIVEDPIQTDTDEPALAGILEYLGVFPLLSPDNRRQHQKAGSLSHGLHTVYDLVNGLTADFLAAPGAMGNAYPGPQQTQIVIDLRDRSHCGSGVLGGSLLIDGNRRGKPVDGIHIRLIHLPQKLSGVRA